MASDKMHVIQVLPDRAECSCGTTMPSTTDGEAMRKARMHADQNRPASVIDRRRCSQKCRDEYFTRNLMVSLHDEDCPRNVERETND